MSEQPRLLDIVKLLNGLPRGRDSYNCFCPSHEDKRRSLSIKIDKSTGKILLYCHAGCSYEAILSAIKGAWGVRSFNSNKRKGN